MAGDRGGCCEPLRYSGSGGVSRTWSPLLSESRSGAANPGPACERVPPVRRNVLYYYRSICANT